jgi:hypothetical protein
MAYAAVRALGHSQAPSIWKAPFHFISRNYHYLLFHFTLTFISISYSISNLYQRITGRIQGGFEAVVDKTIVDTMQKEFPGMNISESTFDG